MALRVGEARIPTTSLRKGAGIGTSSAQLHDMVLLQGVYRRNFFRLRMIDLRQIR